MKNCLFVGSFNPITKSHIEIAKDLLDDNLIDYIYFLPVNSNKKNLISIENRLKMIDLVIEEKMNVLNIYDYNIGGLFNYFILNKLKKEKEINFLVIGSDLFLNFSTFKNYENILNEFKIIIIKRNNYDIESLIFNKYFKYKDSFIIVDKDYKSSSTKARELIHEHENIYLDKEVLDYIKKNNLYN